MEVTVNHMTYTVKKNRNDTDNSRLWFIISKNPCSDYEFYSTENLSKYWQNVTIKGCEYDKNIMKQIK